MSGASRYPRGPLPSPGQEDTIAFFQSDEQLQRALAASSESADGADATEEQERSRVEVRGKGSGESMYVRIFEEMLTTVLTHEQHLFTNAELSFLERYPSLSYPARYLLVRLLLRKRGKWHRMDNLRSRYSHEIGGHLEDALQELCQGYVNPPAAPASVKSEPEAVMDDDLRRALAASLESFELEEHARGEDTKGTADGRPCPPSNHSTSPAKGKQRAEDTAIDSFALPSEAADLSALLETLGATELRDLAKQLKMKHTQTRQQLLTALLGNASSQTTLSFPKAEKSPEGRQSVLPFAPVRRKSQAGRVRDLVLNIIGGAIKIDDGIATLFARLNLIFFRSTTPTPVLLPLILTAAGRRAYPPYVATRTPFLFSSRALLVDYEAALNVEGKIDRYIQGEDRSNLSRLQIAAEVKKLGLSVRPQWEALVAAVETEGEEGERNSLQRFEPGHVLTRIISKLAGALGELKEYEDEMRTLRALLNQKRWRRGKRGGWHERLALVLMNHCGDAEEVLQESMKVVIHGLEDPMTHMIYRPALERRLTRLEKKLDIPLDERHSCDGKLRKPNVTVVKGVRAPIPSASPVKRKSSPGTKASGKENGKSEEEPAKVDRRTGAKSVWVGREGEVSVEILALEWYEAKGYRGFHSEGRIVSTLFTLLFFDILYLPVAGAFETRYQTAPLDLCYDTFYAARKDAIDVRLEEIRNGAAPRIIAEVDERERPKQTWCVGVRWDLFERSDLVEIAEGLGGEGLAAICRLLCEDYGHRGGGVPDLCIWNAAKKKAKFVEVKGPGDSLMETQKVWADILLAAGVGMEVCKVVEEEPDEGNKKAPKKTASKKRKVEVIDVSDSEDTDGGRAAIPATKKQGERRTSKRVVGTPLAESSSGGSCKKVKREGEVVGSPSRPKMVRS